MELGPHLTVCTAKAKRPTGNVGIPPDPPGVRQCTGSCLPWVRAGPRVELEWVLEASAPGMLCAGAAASVDGGMEE